MKQKVSFFTQRQIRYSNPRTVKLRYVGERTKEEIYEFPSNFINTSRYTIITFLPFSLLLQFMRLANVYFLIIAILQSISIISPLTPLSAIAPLVCVLTLSMFKEGVDDYQRHISDKQLNSEKCTLISDNIVKEVTWTDVNVGDLLLIKENQAFPCDLVVLGTAYETGVCFIETSSLDGEKNLKPKSAIGETLKHFSSYQNLQNVNTSFDVAKPTQALYEFEGSILIDGKKLSLNQKQLLLRGAYLRNTKWILGACVYTGQDTKIMKNAEEARIKQSSVERSMNFYIVFILMLQLVLSSILSIMSSVWMYNEGYDHWYLAQSQTFNPSLSSFIVFFTYFLLFNTMIPISLIVSLEFVKLFQAYFIEQDVVMYNIQRDVNAKVSTSSINEELGQVEYIFSDKTGTLTCNQMEFKYCILGDSLYGDEPTQQQSNPNFQQQINHKKSEKHQHSIFNFYDSRLTKLLCNEIPTKQEFIKVEIKSNDGSVKLPINNENDLANEYFTLLSTAHECLAEKNDETGEITYQGPSPDEITLVDAASRLGYQFLGASASTMDVYNKYTNKKQQVTLLKQFEFDSTRKRMTSIVRSGGLIKLYIKGADNIIKQRLKTQNGDAFLAQPYLQFIQDRLSEFSSIGLRTLLMAMKVMSENEYKQFDDQFNSLADSPDREKLIQKLVDSLERDLILLGATAVEDKLQDQVPETIADLLSANIKVWMLTGDKLETAENIARSCKLIQGDMTVMRLSESNVNDIENKMKDNEETFQLCVEQGRKRSYLIEGESLAIVQDDEARVQRFVQVAQDCDSVVCCRVTPKQKALVVRMIKNKLNKITLAIGDGANDVNMIQEAHIGVGLYGNEGMRAVQSSDFAFVEFKCLWKLLLVHGHWSYIRIADMILYFFYKNVIFTIPQFYFAWSSAYSGQTVFDDYYIACYNLIFTCLPLIARATLDQDIYYVLTSDLNKEQTLPKSQLEFLRMKSNYIKQSMTQIYFVGQQGTIFSVGNFVYWFTQGILQSLFIFGISVITMSSAIIRNDGQPSSFMPWSITMFTAIILTVDIKIFLYTRYQTVINFICVIVLSFFVYIVYVIISNYVTTTQAAYTSLTLLNSLIPYFIILFVCGVFLLLDLAIISFQSEFNTTIVDALRQFSKYADRVKTKFIGKNRDGSPEIVGQTFYRELELQRKQQQQQDSNNLKNNILDQSQNNMNNGISELSKLVD